MARVAEGLAPAGRRTWEQPFTRRFSGLTPSALLRLPIAFAMALAVMSLLPSIASQPALAWSFRGAAGVLLAWAAALLPTLKRRREPLEIDVELRKQHYLQACAQGAVFLYWGWYWRPVYDSAPLLAGQLLFAYAFDALLSCTRRGRYTLGFAPFPVVFSTNLFLWFRPQWFYLQFVMLAIGFAAKEFLRWRKDDRSAHIFNPSSFPLAVVSVVLILTGTTAITFGPEIADTQFRPPHIYLALFLIGLPGQLLFGVTTMTMSAAVTMYAAGLAYFAITGTYFFVDSYIPIAVFLGMHLLFTDPSTAPRSDGGRLLFGAIYALATMLFYALLERAGVPTFYDKLLPVPLLNLTIKAIDAIARSPRLHRFDPGALGRGLRPRLRNLAYIGIWATAFSAMSAAHGVGDTHRGHWVPFWQQACAEQRRGACETLASIEATYCRDSGWACNELGIMVAEQRVARPESPQTFFDRACRLGYVPGCQNRRSPGGAVAPARSAPRLADYATLLQEGKGPVEERAPVDVYGRACDQGWMSGCESLGFAHLRGEGTPRAADRALGEFDRACAGGLATACSNAGLMLEDGDGLTRDPARALIYLRRACDLGFSDACRWLEEKHHSATD
jgi:hypothetical protein